jgi:hypothetical protein
MIRLGGIYTIRDVKQPYYWDIVFEWEDELAKQLELPLIRVGEKYDRIYKPSWIRKVFNRLNAYQVWDRLFFQPKKYFLAFHIGPPGVYSFHSRKDVIPIIIDFWKAEDLNRFQHIFSLSKIVFITSREVFNYLESQKIRVNISHLALSLADKVYHEPGRQEKEFDLIQPGRQNEQLGQYTKLLLAEFPELHYVYAKKLDGKLVMFSTRRGNLGEFASREAFLNLLRRTKITVLSAPGLDDDAKRTGGFSPVTPRFLESAACDCCMVGLYPANDDFTYYGIDKICKNVQDYTAFRSAVLKFLQDPQLPDHREFLARHLTSQRAVELKEKLSKL